MHHTIPAAVQFHLGIIGGVALPVACITLWNGDMAWAGATGAIFVACAIASAVIATRH